MPAAIEPAAVASAPRPAAQCRLVARPGICWRPSTTAVWRAITPPPWRLSAITRSSISLGAIWLRSRMARTTTCASSNASLFTSDPLRPRPIGVRRAATITGAFMKGAPCSTRDSVSDPPSAGEAAEAELPGILGRDVRPGIPHQAVHQPAEHHRLLDQQRGAARLGRPDRAGRGRGFQQLDQHLRDRRDHGALPLGILERELERELRDRRAVVGAALAPRAQRLAPLVQADGEGAQPRQRLGLGGDRGAEVLDRLAHALLEQREQQLVLAVEVLVEPAQRLLRAVDHLLDRELAGALLVDQGEGRLQQTLDALLRARTRGAQAPRDRSLAPAGVVLVLRVVALGHETWILSK